MMRTFTRRLRAHAGVLLVFGILSLVTAFLASAAPRTVNQVGDDGLRQLIDAAAYTTRDVTVQRVDPRFSRDMSTRVPLTSEQLANEEERIHQAMEPVLRSAVADKWSAAQSGFHLTEGDGLRRFGGLTPQVSVRYQDGLPEHVRITSGRAPADEPLPAAPGTALTVEAVVSTDVAATLQTPAGSQFILRAPPAEIGGDGGELIVLVKVVGVFAPLDPAAPIWQAYLPMLRPQVPPSGVDNPDPPTYRGAVLVTGTGHDALLGAGFHFDQSWRYRIDAGRVDASVAEELQTAVRRLRTNPEISRTLVVTTSLDKLIDDFAARYAAVRALLAVVVAGLLAAMVGVLLTAARLAVSRRRAELALRRARGASLRHIAGLLVAETALVVTPAVVAGWAAASAVPGRPPDSDWLVAGFGLFAVAAIPALAVLVHRRVGPPAQRGDRRLLRPGLQRLMLELTVLVLAVAGTLTLRRRGLDTETGVDPYLTAVPVLLGLTAAMVALRVYPWPLRLLGRLAARGRGAVAFLGLSRAGREATAAVLPLVVLVVAVAVGVFSGVVRTAVADARDESAWRSVGADYRVDGWSFGPDTTRRLADIDGVAAVAPLSLSPSTKLYQATEDFQALVVAVDAPAYQRVLAASGIDYQLPRDLVTARPGGQVPALVSPRLAARLGDDDTRVRLSGLSFTFRVAAVAESFPSLSNTGSQFVVLPLQALEAPSYKPVPLTGFLLAGAAGKKLDQPAVVRLLADEQRTWVSRVAGAATTGLPTPSLHSRVEQRAAIERTSMNVAITIAFTAGIGGAAGYALLAIGFAVVAGVRVRATTLSRLRTLGLSTGQARGLLAFELVPLVVVALAAGGALGVALPELVAPALGLAAFTGGLAATTDIAAGGVTLAGLAALLTLVVAAAIAAEAAVLRRLGLGQMLRVGEDT